MRILCIGDSLGLPRPGVTYEDTWFFRLTKAFPQHIFVSVFKRAMLINEAVNFFDTYYSFYNPDIVIIQTGICDCSPRTFNANSIVGRTIVKICSFLGIAQFLWRLVKKRERKSTRVFTKLSTFEKQYTTLIELFLSAGVKGIVVVKIGHGSSSVLKKSKFFNHNVDLYNKVIEHICERYPGKVSITSPLEVVTDALFIDGYHCNKMGMDVVFKSIRTELELFS